MFGAIRSSHPSNFVSAEWLRSGRLKCGPRIASLQFRKSPAASLFCRERGRAFFNNASILVSQPSPTTCTRQPLARGMSMYITLRPCHQHPGSSPRMNHLTGRAADSRPVSCVYSISGTLGWTHTALVSCALRIVNPRLEASHGTTESSYHPLHTL